MAYERFRDFRRRTVQVRNMMPGTKNKDLFDAFSHFGDITVTSICPTGRTGMLIFENAAAADRALEGPARKPVGAGYGDCVVPMPWETALTRGPVRDSNNRAEVAPTVEGAPLPNPRPRTEKDQKGKTPVTAGSATTSASYADIVRGGLNAAAASPGQPLPTSETAASGRGTMLTPRPAAPAPLSQGAYNDPAFRQAQLVLPISTGYYNAAPGLHPPHLYAPPMMPYIPVPRAPLPPYQAGAYSMSPSYAFIPFGGVYYNAAPGQYPPSSYALPMTTNTQVPGPPLPPYQAGADGTKTAYDEAWIFGFDAGWNDGYDAAWTDGYNAGWRGRAMWSDGYNARGAQSIGHAR